MKGFIIGLGGLLTICGLALGQVKEPAKGPEAWEVMCEVFSLPVIDAAALRRENKGSQKIYAELLKRVAGKAAVLEEFVVLKTLVAGESEAVSAEEYLYPRGYDPPETPNVMASLVVDHDTSGLSSPSNPWGYELRNLGTTLRLGFLDQLSPSTIVLDLEIGKTSLLGRDSWGKGKSKAVVPRFETQGLDERVILKEGRRILVGTMSPSGQAGQNDRRDWFVFVKAEAVMSDAEKSKLSASTEDPGWNVTCEVFSMTLSEAARLKRASGSDREDYAGLLQAMESEKVKLEEFLSVRTAGDGGISLEGVREMSYADGFEPPELPSTVYDFAKSPEISKELITPATPARFESREVGTTMKAKLVTIDKKAVRLDATLEVVRHLGRNTWGQGVAEAEMPRFTSQRLVSQVKVSRDSPTLLGSMSPPGILQPKEGERQVWLAFVTVSRAEE